MYATDASERPGVGGGLGSGFQPLLAFAWASRRHQRWLSWNLLLALDSVRVVDMIDAPGH